MTYVQIVLVLIVAICLRVFRGADAKTGETVIELNSLQITLDTETGSLLKLSYPGIGTLLDATVNRASIVDLAYPIPAFEPLRLATRYSKDAQIGVDREQVTITWNKLGMNRQVNHYSERPQAYRLEFNTQTRRNLWVPYEKNPFDISGHVSAKVTLRAASDRRSILMKCTVENHSENPIPQVLFPDLMGLVSFGGEAETEFRTCGFVSKPFQELKVGDRGIGFYGSDSRFAGKE